MVDVCWVLSELFSPLSFAILPLPILSDRFRLLSLPKPQKAEPGLHQRGATASLLLVLWARGVRGWGGEG